MVRRARKRLIPINLLFETAEFFICLICVYLDWLNTTEQKKFKKVENIFVGTIILNIPISDFVFKRGRGIKQKIKSDCESAI
jgi:hypothetical protein